MAEPESEPIPIWLQSQYFEGYSDAIGWNVSTKKNSSLTHMTHPDGAMPPLKISSMVFPSAGSIRKLTSTKKSFEYYLLTS